MDVGVDGVLKFEELIRFLLVLVLVLGWHVNATFRFDIPRTLDD